MYLYISRFNKQAAVIAGYMMKRECFVLYPALIIALARYYQSLNPVDTATIQSNHSDLILNKNRWRRLHTYKM